nr:hypothetical transcript [Hymenolepis microstoma]
MLPFGAGDTWQTKFGDYIRFRRSTPVAVAVIFDEDWRHCLLGRGFYSSQWQFPGGKVERNETYADCVIRELKEELSFDSSVRISKGISVFTQSASRNVRAYFVETASTSVPFKPKTRYEIKESPSTPYRLICRKCLSSGIRMTSQMCGILYSLYRPVLTVGDSTADHINIFVHAVTLAVKLSVSMSTTT